MKPPLSETIYQALDRIEAEAEMEVAVDATPLDFFQAVYRDSRQPMQRRMRAAEAALPFVHPKLAVTVDASRDFASRMEEIARQRGMSNVIDSKANHTLPIQTDPACDDRRGR